MPGQTARVEPTEITAGMLHLRPWQPGDEEYLLDQYGDPVTQRWTSRPVPYLPGHAAEDVRRVAPQGWADGDSLSWAVCESTTGRPVAEVTLRAGSDDGGWDVAYGCRPSERGQGIVPQAVGAACRWAFAVLGAQRIEWRAERGNVAALRAAQKAGFRLEALLRGGMRHRGRPVDSWIAGLLPGDPNEDTAALPPYTDRTDGVVTLRRWRSADAADVTRACQDAETARWLPVPVPYTLQAGQAYVDGIVPSGWADGTAAHVAVVDARDGSLLGAVGLTLRQGIGEIGYWTAPEVRGRGIAGRAVLLHSRWGFETLGLPRVELLADVQNRPSQRVAEKTDWRREGIARAHRPAARDASRRRDMVVYARLPGDP